MGRIRLLQAIKNGREVIGYKATDGNRIANISKEDTIRMIERGMVVNAGMQRYKGRVIIRIHEGRCSDKLAKREVMNR